MNILQWVSRGEYVKPDISYPSDGTRRLFAPADKALPKHATHPYDGPVITGTIAVADNILAISVGGRNVRRRYM